MFVVSECHNKTLSTFSCTTVTDIVGLYSRTLYDGVEMLLLILEMSKKGAYSALNWKDKILKLYNL